MKEVTCKDLESMHGLALVEIYKPECQPCKQLEPIIEQLAKDPKYEGSIQFAKSHSITGGIGQGLKLDLSIVPQLILFRDGILLERFTGAQYAHGLGGERIAITSSQLTDRVDRLLLKYRENYSKEEPPVISNRRYTLENRLNTNLPLSDNSLVALAERYLKKDDDGNIIESPEDMFKRIANGIAEVDRDYGGSEDKVNETATKFYKMISSLDFLPNSPTIMNTGRELGQLSACFVLPVGDSIEEIFEAAKMGALVHKSGGGTGYSFSRLRPKNSRVKSTKGIASGPVSFIYVFNTYTEVVKQGGTRRGANMGILVVNHPDILDFINAKGEPNEITEYVANEVARQHGLAKDDPMILTIAKTLRERTQLQNLNLSVGITEGFMEAVENDAYWNLIDPQTHNIREKVRAKSLLEKIVHQAWKSGEPGVVFLDKINEENPTPHIGRIEATNPCIVGSSLIATSKGLERIDSLIRKEVEVVISSELILWSQVQKTLAKNHIGGSFVTGKKQTYKLTTKSGYEIIATADHKILTTKGWKELIKLELTDKVILQSGKSFFNKNAQIKGEKIKWTAEIGIMLGWLIGDGWFRDNNKNCRAGFVFGKSTIKYIKRIKKIFNKIYGKTIKEIRRPNGTINLSYHSIKFIKFLQRLGVKGCKAADKSVPSSIFTAPEKAVRGFLQALFTTDGTINLGKNKTRYVRLTSKSKKLLKETQLLLLNFGIKSRIYERSRSKRVVFSYKNLRGEIKLYESDGILYELQISKDMLPLFLKEIGFLYGIHKKKINQLKNMNFYRTDFVEEVVSIEENGIEEVFDITEPVTHSFIANGLVVHNCGEQPLLPFESCNLGSINLRRHVKKSGESYSVDRDKLKDTVHTAVHFLDNVIDANRYPLPEIGVMTKANRKIGLGIMGFADMLSMLNIPYGSDECISLAEQLMEFIRDEARSASTKLAEDRGVFPNWEGSIYDPKSAHFKGKELRLRNATLTTIAPTGSLSIIADCEAGIEPYFSLNYTKTVMDGKILSYRARGFESILREIGYEADLIFEEIAKGNYKEFGKLPAEIRELGRTSMKLTPEQHISVQAAFQKHTDNAVSKTVNFQHKATEKEAMEVYMLAYKLGCKGVTIYRDRSRDTQVLEETGKTHEDKATNLEKMLSSLDFSLPEGELEKLYGTKLPKERLAIVRQEAIGDEKDIFVTTSYFESKLVQTIIERLRETGIPTEFFTNANHFDPRTQSLTTAFAIRASKDLRAGISYKRIARDLERVPPSDEIGYDIGFGEDRSYINRSIPAAISKALSGWIPPLNQAKKSLTKKKEGKDRQEVEQPKEDENERSEFGFCPECNTFGVISQEGCDRCINCSYSKKGCIQK